jgi:hypothetical protein
MPADIRFGSSRRFRPIRVTSALYPEADLNLTTDEPFAVFLPG